MLAPQRVILDVDAGTDDAVALLLFLFAETIGLVKIEAITCTFGNTNLDNVATNVLRVLEAAERTDIPVYKGANSTFIAPKVSGDQFHGIDGFGDLRWNTKPDLSLIKPKLAALAIGDIVEHNPGKVSIIAFGPLTNIALTMKLFPNFAKNVKRLHVMGGNWKGVGNIVPAAEFNFYMDPEAAYIVLSETKKPVHVTPWEPVLETNITVEWLYKVWGIINNPVLHVVMPAFRTIFPTKAPTFNPADAFAAAAFLFPNEIVKVQKSYSATIELHGAETRGMLVLDHRNATTQNVMVVQELDQEAFENLLLVASNATRNSFKRKSKRG